MEGLDKYLTDEPNTREQKRTPKLDLRNCDCMELMAQFKDKYFDLAIVDPPYAVGDTFRFGSSGAVKGKLERIHKPITWDEAIPTPEYFTELKRVSKNQIIWGANYFNCFSEKGGALVWYKNRGGDTMSQCEIASVSWQRKVDYVPLQILTGFCSNEERIHPTQKPVRLYNYILEQYATKESKILDTHLGSGNIGIVCYFYGVDLVGSEIDKEYFDKLKKNIKDNTRQTSLF